MPQVANSVLLLPSVLDRLLDDDPAAGNPYLDCLDLKDPTAFVRKLREAGEPLSRYLAEQLAPETREAIAACDLTLPISGDLQVQLIDELNRVIAGPFLYEPQRFSRVTLSAQSRRLMESSRKGRAAPTLNRLLLEEAYPADVRPMQPVMASQVSIHDLKQAISRDLEALLNSRRELQDEPEGYPEVSRSLLMYGLPDFTAYSLLNSQHRKTIRRVLEESLAKFEPRLKSVRVILAPQQKFDLALRFRVDALLRLDPIPEPVTFDAVLHLSTRQYSVGNA